MKAQTLSPVELFGAHVRYVVPLFQRPYVWTKEDQWDPLWDDVRTVTEGLLETPPDPSAGPTVAPHFLGAIVLDQQLHPSGFISVRNIVDGQQRLTTLQVLLDATQWVVSQHGEPMDAKALSVLVLNDPAIAQHPDEVFKVWPTDRDQDAFRAAMTDHVEVTKEQAASRVAQAHAFFLNKVRQWAVIPDQPLATSAQLGALVRALRDHLKMVVIDLEPGDNAQVIFETLNHRGSRLLAADLVKNFVFQIAQAQRADVTALYRKHWRSLDNDVWRQPVAQGRFYRPRIDVFLNHWLTMTLLREVQADRVFIDFRDYVRRVQPPIGQLLTTLAADAEVYASLDKFPDNSVEGRFHYRVIRALDSNVISPFLLWILRWDADRLPGEQRTKALTALESWMVRRALCRVTAKDNNRMVVDLLKALDQSGPEVAGDTVESFLLRQTAGSRFWPTDAMLYDALAQTPIYGSLSRARLRMLLEALEEARRGPFGEGQRCPRDLSIEHVMPIAWREHWGPDVAGDEVAALHRDRIVHTLGNLTLVNDKLNPALSNRPWTDTETAERGLAATGKRDYLLRHSELKLNAEIVAGHADSWTEGDIAQRGAELIDRICVIWARPASITPGQPAVLPTEEPDSAVIDLAGPSAEPKSEDHVGKYRLLSRWLREQSGDELAMSFADVEEVLAMPLPPSARNHLSHWYGYDGTALGRAIRDASWKATAVDLVDERVVFVRHDPG